VTAQNSQDWQVSGITVMLTSSSRLPADTVSVGAPVMVIGHTNAQGLVEVDTLETLGPGASLPPLEPSQMEASDTEEQQNQGNAVNGNQQPEQLGNTTYDFQGVVESKNGNIWTINGQPVNVEFAENKSPVSTGVLVEFEGYYSVDGQFIATKIEVKSSGLFKKEPLNSNGKNIGDNKSNDGGNSGGDSNSSNSGSSGSGDSHDGSGDD
jgi:hypothetical protein